MVSTFAEEPIAIDVLANDKVGEGYTLSIAGYDAVGESGGLVTQSGDSLIYTAAEGFRGIDTFTYSATDGVNVGDPALVTVTVKGVCGVSASEGVDGINLAVRDETCGVVRLGEGTFDLGNRYLYLTRTGTFIEGTLDADGNPLTTIRGSYSYGVIRTGSASDITVRNLHLDYTGNSGGRIMYAYRTRKERRIHVVGHRYDSRR